MIKLDKSRVYRPSEIYLMLFIELFHNIKKSRFWSLFFLVLLLIADFFAVRALVYNGHIINPSNTWPSTTGKILSSSIYRKVESDLPGINAYDKNKNKLDDCYVNIISSLPMEQIFDKNSNKKHALYKKIEPDMPIEEAFDKLGNRLFGSYKKAADNEPGLEIYDNFGNKYDGTYVPGKLNDDRFGDMPPRHDDNRPLPGKLKNPFDGQGRDDPREQRIPGKLKNPDDYHLHGISPHMLKLTMYQDKMYHMGICDVTLERDKIE